MKLGNVKALIGRKMGPLPMGAWVIVIAGGFLIAYLINRRGGFGGGGGSVSDDDSGTSGSTDDYGEDITSGLLTGEGANNNPSLGGVIVVNPTPVIAPNLPSIPKGGLPVSITPPVVKVAPKKTPTNTSSKSAGGGGKVYTVKSGDNLWALAQRFYGDGSKWKRILNANPKIKANNQYGYMIYSGTKLRIP